MVKTGISAFLRSLRLLHLSDFLRYKFQKIRNSKKNQDFLSRHPGILLPPDYLIYESFQLDYEKYYTDSIETTEWLAGLFRNHISVYNINVLDWGCGPARIIRHMPATLGNTCFYYGTDYNPTTIEWCKNNIKGVHFSKNDLKPPLDYNDSFFHIIYGISIFTHLSEPMHEAWSHELQRVLSPGGIIVVTTQGNAFRIKLTEEECRAFDRNELVIRGNVREGHRIYSAFQPEPYVKQLFHSLSLVEHQPGQVSGGRPQQDVWIFRKAQSGEARK